MINFRHAKAYKLDLNAYYRDKLGECDLKIIDFGFLSAINKRTGLLSSNRLVGTEWYLAPETVNNFLFRDSQMQVYSLKVDVWAAGAIFCELLTGYRIF